MTPVANPGRILALDVGARKIGVAVSDALGLTAQGLDTLRRSNRREDMRRLERLLRQQGVTEIVVGYPLHLSGDPSRQSERVSQFADRLRQKFGLPVHLWDERLSSAEAGRILRQSEIGIEKRAQAVDRLSAVLILQSFLDRRNQPAP